MVESYEVVVVGGGQAGLAMSRQLSDRGVEHVVLERARVGHRWRTERWDSLRFQFPNWLLQLPGWCYDGPDPDGFAPAAEIAAIVERYAATLPATVREHTEVTGVRPDGSGWLVETVETTLRCRAVVVATGPFQQPVVPAAGSGLPPEVAQLHSRDYRNPAQLPAGGVLVVGSGGSGSQIAEELSEAGRPVYLAVSPHRWIPRRCGARDALWWLLSMGVLDRPVTELPGGRPPPSLLVTGVAGGHDMNLRRLQATGVELCGRARDITDGVVTFDDDAEAIAAAADAGCAELLRAVDEYAARHGLDRPAPPAGPGPVRPIPARTRMDLRASGVRTVLWCTGYRPDFGWVQAPCFDDRGAPRQRRGVTDCPGLYFLGLHWMHTLKSGIFFGVGDDAAHLADTITAQQRT